MNKWYSLLRRLVERIRKHMDAVFLTMGGILIPLGFYLKIEQPQLDDIATTVVLLGLVTWVLAYWLVKRKEKRERLERVESREQERKERTEFCNLLIDIRQELKEFNQGKK
jgi:L-lactate permease